MPFAENVMPFLYPSDPLKTRQPDEFYAEEIAAAQQAGFAASMFSLEELQVGVRKGHPAIPTGAQVLYRGWYFVINARAFADESESPAIVGECARRIKSRFFSVDVTEREDGQLRVVEIGDGQVSDLVGWTIERFVEVCRASFT
jgi:hypothetical protein